MEKRKRFGGLKLQPTTGALRLGIKYSLDNVPEPFLVNKTTDMPPDFLNEFSLSYSAGNILEDFVSNDLGWYIISPKVAEFFRKARNVRDLNFIPLPATTGGIHPDLPDYFLFGITRRIEALDKDRSDVRWSKQNPGKVALAIYKGTIKYSEVPDDCDVFHLVEHTGVPILRGSLAEQLQELNFTGYGWQVFDIS